MYLARGVRMPLYYFFQNHLFDLMHQTDTHSSVEKANMFTSSINIKHSIHYMSSWSNVIKKIHKILLVDINEKISKFNFVDVGCGKGKVVFVWRKLSRQTPRTIGLDFVPILIETARANSVKIFKDEGEFFCKDTTDVDFQDFGQHLILYLYNPFDELIMRNFLNRLENIDDCYIAYINPIHREVFLEFGFKILHDEQSWHPNLSFTIFHHSKFA